jgi:hypothetical protein
MDSYGVIDLGTGLLSIPGLFFYLTFVGVSVWLAVKLVVRTVPNSQRKVEYFTAGISAAVIATWAVIFFGLWFYVGN